MTAASLFLKFSTYNVGRSLEENSHLYLLVFITADMLNLNPLRILCRIGSCTQISKNLVVTKLLQFFFLFYDFHNKLQILRQFGKTVEF